MSNVTKRILQAGLIIAAFALAGVLWFLFVITGAFSILAPIPPRPEITYGEFPIRVIFELDGEIKTIEDIVIAEFVGSKSLGTGGRTRVWTSRLKSGNERLVLLRVENEGYSFVITTRYGLPEYYMGDFYLQSREQREMAMANRRYLGYIRWENGEMTANRTIREDEAWEMYNLRIIEVQHSEPLENRFVHPILRFLPARQ